MLRLSRVAALSLVIVLSGCSTLLRDPAPSARMADARIGEFTSIRYTPLADSKPVADAIRQAFVGETPDNYETLPDGGRRYDYLAVSGGGSDGAFGAGLLNGWSAHGDRPKFKFVTGVSTGSLIAPLAFLGSDYDAKLKEAYTTIDAAHVFVLRDMIMLPWAEALADTAPLRQIVAKYVSEDVLDAIAAEHAKGRRLYVATTNLDEEQPVIWDMGAIASSKNPGRLALFREILVASSSIPAFFPPVLMKVTIDGKIYDEMHVDGGVFFQAFGVGAVVDLPAAIRDANPDFSGQIEQRLYVIRNGRIDAVPSPVARGLGSISARAIATLIKVSGINDLYRLYLGSLQDDVEFRYVTIPRGDQPLTTEEFNKEEMNRKFEMGRKMGIEGIPWQSTPPGYSTPEAPTTVTSG